MAIDIKEQQILELNENILALLLIDHSTKQNIKWATDTYLCHGVSYAPESEICVEQITGMNTDVIQPRISKSLDEQEKRTRINAEVFTPSWICNKQNNLIDEQWFGRKDVFNIVHEETWTPVTELVKFPANRTWMEYIDSRRIEITCGEAPYLVSRYDTVTGKEISIESRVGLLDRKLRIVNENTNTEEDWYKWTVRAYQSIYGYEYQGDNVLLARENLLHVFAENMYFKFGHGPNQIQLKKIANIISWNIWQMDGITMMAPYSEQEKVLQQLEFDFFDDVSNKTLEPIPCIIKDWRANRTETVLSMMQEG